MAEQIALRAKAADKPRRGASAARVNGAAGPDLATPARRSARRLQREQEILHAASAAFLEKGFERSSVAEIAARVGVVEGLVFRYYPTKRDLLDEVLRKLYEPLIADVGAGFARITGLRGRLRFIVWRHIRFYTENPGFSRLILHEVRIGAEYGRSVLHDLHVRYTGFLIETMRQAVIDGELERTKNHELIRSVVYGGLEHLMWPVLYGNRQVDVERLADTFTDQVLQGLVGASPRRTSVEDRLARLEQLVGAATGPAKRARHK